MTVPAIALESVTLERDRRRILSNVTFAVRPGEFIGVFGPNGAGKTTLLRAILGLLAPTTGSIRVFGTPPSRGNLGAGYLPQQRTAADFNLRGWDFVASAWRGERWGIPRIGRAGREEVERAIAAVDAEALAGRPLRALSGGERQRLLLAQALIGKPKLLLLDEPLVNLDPHFQQATVALVKRIQTSEGITVLFTAHDVNPLLGAMDRVLYLGQGRAALGTVDEVIADEVLTRLYGTPIEVLRIKGRVLVVSGHGPLETEAHRHDH